MKNNKDIISNKADELFKNNSNKIIKRQIDRYFDALENGKIEYKKYKIGDKVLLPKGTLIHGTYKNIEGLKEIVKNGLISSDFIDGRHSKYPSCVGVWNLKKDYYLKDYINFYSGGTLYIMNNDRSKEKTRVIPFDKMDTIMKELVDDKDCFRWYLEQTKEARFMPSLVQDNVQIAVIFNGNNKYIKNLLKGDILNISNVSDEDVKPFVNEKYYDKFIVDRKNKDDFFTDRESAVLYGIPSNFIEGVLVGRRYESDAKILDEIKEILPNVYVCNLNGIIIK